MGEENKKVRYVVEDGNWDKGVCVDGRENEQTPEETLADFGNPLEKPCGGGYGLLDRKSVV